MDLIDDCIACGVDKLIEEQGGLVWEPEKFDALKEHVRASKSSFPPSSTSPSV